MSLDICRSPQDGVNFLCNFDNLLFAVINELLIVPVDVGGVGHSQKNSK